jgi:hypothetical protein
VVFSATTMNSAQGPAAPAQREGAVWARPYISRSVVIATPHGKVSGRLVSADENDIVVDVRNPELWATPRYERTSLSMAEVRRVSVREKDSIADGVLIGAIAMVVCLRWAFCSQGFDGKHDARDWAVGIGVGALLGGGFDASHQRQRAIYRPPATADASGKPAMVLLSLRF